MKHFFTELGSPLRWLPDYRRRRLVFYLYLLSSLFITCLRIWHAAHVATRRVMSPKLCPASMEMCESECSPDWLRGWQFIKSRATQSDFYSICLLLKGRSSASRRRRGTRRRRKSKRKTTLKALRYSNMRDKLIVWKIVNLIEIYCQLIRI